VTKGMAVRSGQNRNLEKATHRFLLSLTNQSLHGDARLRASGSMFQVQGIKVVFGSRIRQSSQAFVLTFLGISSPPSSSYVRNVGGALEPRGVLEVKLNFHPATRRERPGRGFHRSNAIAPQRYRPSPSTPDAPEPVSGAGGAGVRAGVRLWLFDIVRMRC